jgi:DeoR/GlpR family transcriptional regulator of sugar metabolism
MEEAHQEAFNLTDRQSGITLLLLEHGSVLIEELTERFGVSRMTIHRDLDDLERRGVLRKVRNGATALPSGHFESDVRFRINRQVREKEAIARAAVNLIEPGQSIIFDDATTLLPLVRLLPDLASLTIITNFLPILEILKGYSDISLINLGGQYLPRFDTFTGLLTEQALSALHADLYITSTTAICNQDAYHPDPQIVSVKRLMMRCARSRYLLADHTKFGRTALHKFVPLETFDAVVVDDGLAPEILDDLRSHGVQVNLAPCA